MSPKLTRFRRSVTWADSVIGLPWISSHISSRMPLVSMTSVSPSQCPVEYPFHVGFVQDHHHAWCLHNPAVLRQCPCARKVRWHAVGMRIFPSAIGAPYLHL